MNYHKAYTVILNTLAILKNLTINSFLMFSQLVMLSKHHWLFHKYAIWMVLIWNPVFLFLELKISINILLLI